MLPTIDLEGNASLQVPEFDVNSLTPAQKEYIGKQTLANDRAFKDVLSDTRVMSDVIEVFLGFPVTSIKYLNSEDYRKAAPDYASAVKFDVICQTDDGRTVNVEVQNAKASDLVRRARFYSSMMDAFFVNTKRGTDYSIPDSFVLFFCSDASYPFTGSVAYGSMNYVALGDGATSARDVHDGRNIMFVNFDKIASGETVPLGFDGRAFCQLFRPGYKLTGSIFDYALQRLNMFKESAVGMSEILKEKYEREHMEALLAKERAEGAAEERSSMMVSLFEGLKRNGYTLDRAIELAGELLPGIPTGSLTEVAVRIFM